MNNKLKNVLIFPVKLVFQYDKPQESHLITGDAFYEAISLMSPQLQYTVTDQIRVDFAIGYGFNETPE